jgi:predicted nuclease of predicted toxin-antitoxin system
MLRLISDQNFNARILRGLRRRMPNLEVVRALDVGLACADDPDLLEWTGAEGRILLTHDVNTILGFAYDRVRAGLPMPGVFLVARSMSIGQAIDDLELAVRAQTPDDCKDRVLYFPL